MAPGSPRSGAPEPARRPAGGAAAVPLVGGGRLPLAFIGGGALAFVAAAGWLALVARQGPPVFAHPAVVAIAHLWLPGFLLSVCLGATYQLMPVVLGAPPRLREGWLWTHAGLHFTGVALLVAGLAGGRYLLAGAGGLLATGGVAVLVATTLRTFLVSKRRDAAAWSFVFAAGWLLATVTAGALLAANRRHGFLPLSTLDLLRAHAHLGLVGYFATLLQGVTFQLVPMFTLGEARRPRLALAGLAATQMGMPFLAAGLAWGARGLALIGASAAVTGLGASGAAFAATLASRRRRRLDPGVRAFVLGLGLLAAGAAGGLGLVFFEVGAERFFALAGAYGLVVVAGGLSLAVLGMLAKILPFLVWMRAYGPRVGKNPVPLATTLSSRPLEELWLGAHLAGLALLVGGLLAGAARVSAAGAALLALGALVWLANAARVAGHLRTRPAATRATPASSPVASISSHESLR